MMNKKKLIQISAGSFLLLIVAILLIPILFKGKIVAKVKQMANESLTAKLDFREAEVTLFKKFPQLEVSLKELVITNTGTFEGKELLHVGSLSTTVSLSSIWKSNGIEVSEIVLNHPQLHFEVDPTGKANWEILKPAAGSAAATGTKPLRIDLNRIQLINSQITYQDDQSKMKAGFRHGNFELSGKLTGNDTRLNFNGQADSILFDYNGQKLISGMQVSGTGTLQANFDKISFGFLSNKFVVNQLPIELQGTFTMGEQEDQYDLSFQSNGSGLENLIGFLPSEQQNKLKAYQKSGTLAFSGQLKGAYSENNYPALQATLKLSDGRMKYPGKSNEIDKIELEASLTKPQGSMDSLKINVSKLNASIAGHPMVADVRIQTPLSNPMLNGNLVGEIDFSSLKQTIPLDSMEIGGLARANIHFNGPISAIDQANYELFQTKGSLNLQDFYYRSPSFADRLGIQSAGFGFNSREIAITSMKGKLGTSDFAVDGSISDYWSYLLKNGILRGNVKIKSDLLDVTQLMNNSSTTADTIHADPYVIPARIDLSILADVAKINYNRMEIKNTNGKLVIKEQKLNLDQLSMNLLKGKMVVSGIYSAAEKSAADFNFQIDIKEFDLPTAFQTVGIVRHILPFAGNSRGNLTTGLKLTGKLGKDYAPYFESLNGNGMVAIKNLELTGAGMFAEIGKYFRRDLFTNVTVNDFASNITLTNGAIAISQFTTKVANQEVTVSGNQSLALDLNYQLNFRVNKNDLASDVTNMIGMIPGTENIEKYPIKIDVVGKLKKPEIKVDLSEAKNLVATEFKKKAGSTIKDVAKKFGLEGLFK